MDSTLSDDELIGRVSQGEKLAFHELYQRYKSMTFGYLVRLLGGDKVRAEDAMQTTWINVAEHASSYRGKNQFRGWLFQIASNEVRMMFRKASNRSEVGVESDEILDSLSGDDDFTTIEEEMIQKQQYQKFMLAIEELPDRQRQILVEWFTEDLSQDELGKRYGMSAKAIKSLLCRARKSLEGLLRE